MVEGAKNISEEEAAGVTLTIHPCPFCGNGFPGSDTDLSYYVHKLVGSDPPPDDYTLYWVECDECSAQGPTNYKIEKAIERWNWVADRIKENYDSAGIKWPPLQTLVYDDEW